jgi:phytoene synthase
VPAADILNGRQTPQFTALMQFQDQRARGYYDRALAALPASDRRAQRPGLIMAAIYKTLLDEIGRDGFHVLTQRISLTPLRKFWIAWRTWISA